MKVFRDVIEDCGLAELEHSGDTFTWCNRRLGDNFILERLDRFFGSSNWDISYPFASACTIDFYGYDHRPIMITLCPIESASIQKSSKRLYFEHKWFLDKEFPSFLYQSWQDSGVLNDLPSKLKSCQAKLKSWAGQKFDHFRRKLVSLRRSLNQLLNSNDVVHNFQRIVELEHDIDRLSLQE